MRRSPRIRQLTGLALVALVLVGHLAGALHLVTVQHVACPEHGELVHSSVQPPEASAVQEDVTGNPLRAVPAPAEEEHHHCRIVPAKRELALDAQVFATWRPADTAPPPIEAGSERPLASIARLALAPKQSPPA